MKNKTIVFDLDDTLYNEIDYLTSAYKEIAAKLSTYTLTQIDEICIFNLLIQFYNDKKNPFEEIIRFLHLNEIKKEDLLKLYRNHIPNIKMHLGFDVLLQKLKKNNYNLGVITDGRIIQQRNKIHSLGLEQFVTEIVISEEFGSEKPDIRNFTFFHDKFPGNTFMYVADNPKKDFISPNQLGWDTVCLLERGRNIHGQNFNIPMDYLPKYYVRSSEEIFDLINKIKIS